MVRTVFIGQAIQSATAKAIFFPNGVERLYQSCVCTCWHTLVMYILQLILLHLTDAQQQNQYSFMEVVSMYRCNTDVQRGQADDGHPCHQIQM